MAALPESWLARDAVADPMRPAFLVCGGGYGKPPTRSRWCSSPLRAARRCASRPASSTCCTSSASARCPSRSAATRPSPSSGPHDPRRGRGDARPGQARPRATAVGRARPVRHALAGGGRPGAATCVVVAGGIGLAPLRPALYHLLAHRGAVRPRGPALRRAHARRPALRARAARLARPVRRRRRGHGGPRSTRTGRARSAWSRSCSSALPFDPPTTGAALRPGGDDALQRPGARASAA